MPCLVTRDRYMEPRVFNQVRLLPLLLHRINLSPLLLILSILSSGAPPAEQRFGNLTSFMLMVVNMLWDIEVNH